MSTRTITGPLRGYVSGDLVFTTLADMVSSSATINEGTQYTITPSPTGVFRANLPVPDDGSARYEVRLTNNMRHVFKVSAEETSYRIGDLIADYEDNLISGGTPGPQGPAGAPGIPGETGPSGSGGGIESFWYADAASRVAATDVTSDDAGKLAFQADNNSYWRLMGFVTPHVTDDFNRADDIQLWTAVTGEDWQPVISDGWQIVSNEAALISGGSTSGVVLDADITDGEATVTIVQNYGYGDGLIFRYQDTDNYFSFVNTGDGYYSCKRVLMGTGTTLGSSTGITPAHGDIIRVHFEGPAITCYVNDVEAWAGTNSALQSATKHGMTTRGALARFDDFDVVAIDSIPVWLNIIVPIVPAPITAPLVYVDGSLTLPVASYGQPGYMSSQLFHKVDMQLLGSENDAQIGDILYTVDDASGRVERLPVGSDGQVLSVVDGIPTWIDLP